MKTLLSTIALAVFLTACGTQQPVYVQQQPVQAAPVVVQQPAPSVVYASANPCDVYTYDPILCRQALAYHGYYNNLGVYIALSALHDWAWYNSQETVYVHSHPYFRPTTVIIHNPPARLQPRPTSTVINSGGTYTPRPTTATRPGSGTTAGNFKSTGYVSRTPATSAPTSSYIPRSTSTSSSSFSRSPSSSSSSGRRFGK